MSLCFIVYYPVLLSQVTVGPDAQFILPILDKITSPGDYLYKLFNFETLDFQPVRDLSLLVDQYVLKHTNVRLYIFQNLIFWSGSSFVVFKILELLFPLLSKRVLFFLVCVYSVYPLFVATLSWNMAIKHILAYFFLCLALLSFLHWIREKKRRHLVQLNLFYLLSILSQPIGILWPFWIPIFLYYKSRESLKKFGVGFFSLAVSFITVSIVNYLYYETSPTFRTIYNSKTSDAFDLADKLLAFGHYIFQLTLPYYQSFYYDLGHWSVLAGLGLFVLLIYLYRGFKLPADHLIVWLSFSLLPLVVVLNTPKTKYDTYLLLPALGLFLVLVKIYELKPFALRYLIPIFIFWSVFSNVETRWWINEKDFSFRSYYRRPNCTSAIRAARQNYAEEIKLPNEIKRFLFDNKCMEPSTQFEVLDQIILNSLALYYEDDISLSSRKVLLKSYGTLHWFARLIYDALLIKTGDVLAAELDLKQVAEDVGDKILYDDYQPIVAKVIYPFCLEHPKANCVHLASQFTKKREY